MKAILLILTFVAGTVLRAGEGMIHGRVMGLDENGALTAIVSGAKIELQNESGATVSNATSNAAGYYELTGLDAGDYRYRVTAAGYKTEDEKRGFAVTDVTRDYAHDFLLWKEGLKNPRPAPVPVVAEEMHKPLVHGRVYRLDAEGKLVGVLPGAKVELLSGGKLVASTTAQATGYYIIREVAPGDYQYRVTAVGVEPEDKGRGFTVPEDTLEYVQDYLLGPPPPKRDRCDLAILVVKLISNGKDRANDARLPVANAKLVFQPLGNQQTPLSQPFVTDTKGEYLAKNLGEGDYTVAIDASECEPFTGPLKVTCDKDGDVIFELQPCNELLHGYVRLMLTDGWGRTSSAKAAAERAYRLALKADPKGNCGVNHACGLTQLSAGDYTAAQQSFAAAIGKKSDSTSWDRACEVRLWMNLCLHQPAQAVREIRSLVQNHYATRAVTQASKDTAYVCGIALGLIKGPWKDMVGGGDAVLLESELLSTLQGELQSECARARDHVAEEYGRLKAAEDAARSRLMTEVIEKRNAEVARLEERQAAISSEVAALDVEIQALQATVNAADQRYRVQIVGFMQQRQQLALQVAPLQQRQQQIAVCMARDQREYQAMATQSPTEATQVVAEIQQHQLELQQIQVQMTVIRNQDVQMAAQIATLQGQFNREVGMAQASLNTKLQQRERLAGEFDRIDHERTMPIDPSVFSTPEIDDLVRRGRSLKTYSDYPLESRREELLDQFDCGAAKDPKRLVKSTPVSVSEPAFTIKPPASVRPTGAGSPSRTLPSAARQPDAGSTMPATTPSTSEPSAPKPRVPLPPGATAAQPPPNVGDPAEVVVTNNHTSSVRIFGIAPGAENEQHVRTMESGDEAMIPVRIGQTLIIKAASGGKELQRRKVGKKLEVLKIGAKIPQ